MEHHFNIELATKLGIEEAIFLNNLYYWLQKNAANGKNFFDGSYWTYNTKQAYTEIFPYMSYDKIKRMINLLREQNIIKTGHYDENKMNRTLWYAFTECGLKMMKDAGYKVEVLGFKDGEEEDDKNCNDEKGQEELSQKSVLPQCTTNINKTDKNNKEKTSIDIDVKNDAEASAQSDEEKYFYTYLKEHCPFVYKMQVPLTYEQYKKACSKYSREKIWETLDAMNNWKELNKKRRYAYKTLLVWLEKDKKQYT
jgi:hypothetical protein